jgi:hypothetical protein
MIPYQLDIELPSVNPKKMNSKIDVLLINVQTDRAAMLDEILDYVKFLRLQVKVCFLKCSVVLTP